MNFEEAKKADRMMVKGWFVSKMKESLPYGWRLDEFNGRIYANDVEAETEKAIKVTLFTESIDGERDGSHIFWIPKSCIWSVDEEIASVKAKEEASEKRFEDGKARYQKLIDFCKANNIKGARVGFRAETLLNMVKKAGLSYNY